MACCASNFSSDIFNIPNCDVTCLSSAEPGSIFIGADGSIWILTGTDPCNPGDWDTQNDCCIRLVGDTGFIDMCCGSIVNLTSPDDSINIVFNGDTIEITTNQGLPLPVSLFCTEITGALSGSVDGSPSTSTQDGVNITYAWAATGPGALNFDTPTAATSGFTATVPGDYTITLTVTDDNGNTQTFCQTIYVPAQDECNTVFEIPDTAFANNDVPTDVEALTWITANGPFDCGTYFWFMGTELNPVHSWVYA